MQYHVHAFVLCTLHRRISSFMTYLRVCNQINTTGATIGAGTAHPSGAPEFTPGFQRGSCYSIFSFICMFCRLFYIFFWPLCCLFFFDIRILITLLVSSNSSYNIGKQVLCTVSLLNKQVIFFIEYKQPLSEFSCSHFFNVTLLINYIVII